MCVCVCVCVCARACRNYLYVCCNVAADCACRVMHSCLVVNLHVGTVAIVAFYSSSGKIMCSTVVADNYCSDYATVANVAGPLFASSCHW